MAAVLQLAFLLHPGSSAWAARAGPDTVASSKVNDWMLEDAPEAPPASDNDLQVAATEPGSPDRSAAPSPLTLEPLGGPGPDLSLELGELRSVPVEEVTRVAVGNPAVADVTVVSANEIFLQGKAAGVTNLIVWDNKGQRVSRVEVLDHAVETTEGHIRSMLDQLNLPRVTVKRENGHLFVVGEVDTPGELTQLTDMLTAFGENVTNLATLTTTPPAPGPPELPPVVKITVQILEMNRDAKDKLGVDWMDSLTVTETTFGPLGPQDQSVVARVGEAFRLGAFSRSGPEGRITATMNMLVQQGKARILAEPKLVAASGKEANAFLGVEVPVVTATDVSAGVVTQSIEFKKTGVELKFTPTVLSDGQSIQLKVNAKVSSIDLSNAITVQGGTRVPGFRVRQTDTEVVTGSGQSILMSGLLQDEEKRNLSQIPAVGSIPVLGYLFRSTEFVRGQTELILVVTPELLEDEEADADRTFALEQALVGQEVAASVEDPRLRYALQLQDRIAKAIRYPAREKELNIEGTVKLRLHLFADGTLGRVVVSESSGVESLDTEALKAAESQSPYPAFPTQMTERDLWLEIPVIFRPQ